MRLPVVWAWAWLWAVLLLSAAGNEAAVEELAVAQDGSSAAMDATAAAPSLEVHAAATPGEQAQVDADSAAFVAAAAHAAALEAKAQAEAAASAHAAALAEAEAAAAAHAAAVDAHAAAVQHQQQHQQQQPPLQMPDGSLDYQRVEWLLATGQPEDVNELKRIIHQLLEKEAAAISQAVAASAALEAANAAAAVANAAAAAAAAEPPAPAEPQHDCSHWLGCKDCVSHGCAWCIAGRTCKNDVAWNCQGDVDHVGLSGIGKHTTCPIVERSSSVSASFGEDEPILPFSTKRKRSNETDSVEGEEGEEKEGDGYEYSRELHFAELQRRAALAANTPPRGATHPYETLNITIAASSGEIRKVYRKLSLLFHPDKNTDSSISALAHSAFTDITRAFEILGSPEKRAFFDDVGGGQETESFDSEAAYQQWGQKNTQNFYQGHPFITPLSEAIWPKRVSSGDTLWLVEFYAPWCGACQSAIPELKRIADALQDNVNIEVGAVNCAVETRICQEWFAIRAYPTFLAINDKHGTRQEYHHGSGSIEEWILAVDREYRYLLHAANIHKITTPEAFAEQVVNSTSVWVIVWLDGADCGACKTAKTNAMRLSASLRGYEGIQVGLINCQDQALTELCTGQGLPESPYAPVVKGYPMGNKTRGGVMSQGEVLYNSNEVEPHIALEMLEKMARLLLQDTASESGLSEVDPSTGYARDKKPDDPPKPPERPPPMWNGPARRDPIAWGGSGGPSLTGPRLGM